MKLIPEWRRAWRMLSVRFGALALAWLMLPADQQAKALSLLPWLTTDQVAGLLVALGLIGRVFVQPKVSEP